MAFWWHYGDNDVAVYAKYPGNWGNGSLEVIIMSNLCGSSPNMEYERVPTRFMSSSPVWKKDILNTPSLKLDSVNFIT